MKKKKLIKAESEKRENSRELVNAEDPNLYREIFPYSEVCRIPFDGDVGPVEFPEDIWITDTTFRDGQQARPPYTVEEIVHIFGLLHKLGGKSGLIRQTEFFLYSDKDRKAVEECLACGYEFPEVTGWIRAVASDFDLVKAAGLKETGILTSCSDYHIFLKLGKTREEAFNDYIKIIEASLNAGVKPRCHIEDLTRADFYGFVLPFIHRIADLSKESGVDIKVRLCDTMGYGVPYPGAALPRSVPKLVSGMIHEGGLEPSQLEWHGHNDFHKVLINASTAWLYGCSGANGTILGLGERTGNPPIEALVMEYIGLTGDDGSADTTVITEIAEYFTEKIGYDIPSNYPLTGKDFNVTRAGIHADGVLKNEEIYNIFDTQKILNRPLGVTVTDKSGVAGIAYWINANVIKGRSIIMDKRDPRVLKIYEWVCTEYKEGRTTGISDEELMEQAQKYMPELLNSGE